MQFIFPFSLSLSARVCSLLTWVWVWCECMYECLYKLQVCMVSVCFLGENETTHLYHLLGDWLNSRNMQLTVLNCQLFIIIIVYLLLSTVASSLFLSTWYKFRCKLVSEWVEVVSSRLTCVSVCVCVDIPNGRYIIRCNSLCNREEEEEWREYKRSWCKCPCALWYVRHGASGWVRGTSVRGEWGQFRERIQWHWFHSVCVCVWMFDRESSSCCSGSGCTV